MLYQKHLAMSGIQTHNLVVIGTDCIGSCKSNYHTIMTTTAPPEIRATETWMYLLNLFQVEYFIFY
jgi:hypothetical protein